jgi:hypothetical protein
MRTWFREPRKISHPEDEPPYIYRVKNRRAEWRIAVGSLSMDGSTPRGGVDVRTSNCPACGATSSTLGHVSMGHGRSSGRKHRGLSMNYGVVHDQERVIPRSGQLIVCGFPPEACPGCGSRLWLDTAALDFAKVFEMCQEGGLVDIEALPWMVSSPAPTSEA